MFTENYLTLPGVYAKKLYNFTSAIAGSILLRAPVSSDNMIFVCGVSRSGTTLLTTVLDSHSQISLGYELIPPPLPAVPVVTALLNEVLAESGVDFSRCGSVLRKRGHFGLGQWITRCHRAGADLDDMKHVFSYARASGVKKVYSLVQRLTLAYLVVKRLQVKTGASIYGFKFSCTHFNLGHRMFPNGFFVYIIRDPRDVAVSQKKRGFKKSVTEICLDWNRYTNSFLKFHEKCPDNSHVVRYESLVSDPREEISRLFEKLPLTPEPELFRFYESKATIHTSNHPNSQNLKKDFFTDSIGRWKQHLGTAEIRKIERLCRKNMRIYRYEKSN